MWRRLRPSHSQRYLLIFLGSVTALFGLASLTSNSMALLAKPEYRLSLGAIPYPVFWMDVAAGALWVVAGWGVGSRFRWALYAAWGLALLHALVAAVLWLWHFGADPVEMGTLISALLREAYWVLVGLYLGYLWNPNPTQAQEGKRP